MEKSEIDIIFKGTTGYSVPPGFGEPFITAFADFGQLKQDEAVVAGYVCALFLSAILAEFPTAKLHTFVHNTKDCCSRFSFNCKAYDAIYSRMSKKRLAKTILIDANGENITHHCDKKEILEAFDFYTNQ